MKLASKVTEIYCIADDFCKEYNLELNKNLSFALKIPLPIVQNIAREKDE
nr:hypothetical protein [Alloprevotella rava]